MFDICEVKWSEVMWLPDTLRQPASRCRRPGSCLLPSCPSGSQWVPVAANIPSPPSQLSTLSLPLLSNTSQDTRPGCSVKNNNRRKELEPSQTTGKFYSFTPEIPASWPSRAASAASASLGWERGKFDRLKYFLWGGGQQWDVCSGQRQCLFSDLPILRNLAGQGEFYLRYRYVLFNEWISEQRLTDTDTLPSSLHEWLYCGRKLEFLPDLLNWLWYSNFSVSLIKLSSLNSLQNIVPHHIIQYYFILLRKK